VKQETARFDSVIKWYQIFPCERRFDSFDSVAENRASKIAFSSMVLRWRSHGDYLRKGLLINLPLRDTELMFGGGRVVMRPAVNRRPERRWFDPSPPSQNMVLTFNPR
jgi:hypothetical protein